MKKICIVTGSRAEFDLLKWIIWGVESSSKLTAQVVTTGSHCGKNSASTHEKMKINGVKVNRKLEMLFDTETKVGIAKSIGVSIMGFPDLFDDLKPDIVLLLGDRFEIFGAAISAMVLGIPIAHLHGGEVTSAVIDEPIRHSITKMATYHFTAAEEYKRESCN